MGKILALIPCLALVLALSDLTAYAETGKCVVTDVAGNKMVIECNQQTKGFDKGSKIKIKTEKKNPQEKDR